LNTIREGIGFTVVDLLCSNASSTGSLIFSFYIGMQEPSSKNIALCLLLGWKLTLIFLGMTPIIVTAFIITRRVTKIDVVDQFNLVR